jgi:hypothetical protein
MTIIENKDYIAKAEIDYREGSLTDTQIACKYLVSSAHIGQLAKKYGWVRGEEKKPIDEPESFEDPAKSPLLAKDKTSDDLANGSIELAERLLEELHQVTTYIGELEQLIIDDTAMDRDDRRRKAMMKAVSLGERANILKTLSNILVQTRGIINPAGQVGSGKKDQANARAEKATKGKFSPSAAPLRIAK